MSTESPEFLIWDIDVPLLNNRFFLYDMAKLLFWTGVFSALIFGGIALWTDGWRAVDTLMTVLGLILLGLMYLFALVALIFFGNRYPVSYLVADAGVSWEQRSGRGKAASQLAILAGLLTGSAGTAGAGLLAKAEEEGLLLWDELRKIKGYPAVGVISLMNSWRVVQRIYCLPDQYDEVMRRLRRGAARAQVIEIGRRVEPAPASGSLALELFRRAAALCGLAGGLWLAMWTPPAIIEVSRSDFARDFERRYGERKGPRLGAMDAARDVLRATTHPGSLEAYVRRTTESHRVDLPTDIAQALFRRADQPLYFDAADPALAQAMPDIRAVWGSGWNTSYAAVESESPLGYLVFRYSDRPRESKADTALIYPERARSWMWFAAAALVYLLLPWPKPAVGRIGAERLSLILVDLIGALFAAAWFVIPLWAVHYTAELNEEWVVAGICWAFATTGVCLMAWSARLSSRSA